MQSSRRPLFLRYILVLCLILVSSAIFALTQFNSANSQDNQPTGDNPWDLKIMPQAGLFTFYDAPAGASQTGKPLEIGDFNGDGCGDLAITGQNAISLRPEGSRREGGHIRIVMDVCDIEGRIALEEEEVTPSYTVLTIYGAYAGDMAGTETYVGDFNSDGYSDLMLSAQNNDGASLERINSGAVYVVLGNEDFAFNNEIDLRHPPAHVLTFYGANINDRFGMWVGGGDFDGDGYEDMLIGANQGDGYENSRANAGEAWILYGDELLLSKYRPVTDLATADIDATWIIGADFDDLLGSCVWGADLNDDGFDDAIVSAALWRGSAGVEGLSFGGGDGPANSRYNAGETYVVYGYADMRGEIIDLATLLDETGTPIDESITVIYGADQNDLLGEEIATGDLDGDGQPDLVLGTLIGDGANNRLEESGEAWVIYVDEDFPGQAFDLAQPDFEKMVVIYPDQAYSKGGDTMRVGDLDQDGVDDLFYGVPDYDPRGYDLALRRNAGYLAIIFGKTGGFPHIDGQIILPSGAPEDLVVRYIVGADENDMMSYGMAIGDVDGDGVIDIAPNGMGGDGLRNTLANAGEIYVISGAEFLASDHSQLDETPSATEIVQSSSTNTPLPIVADFDTSALGSPQQGFIYYQSTCAGCHGSEGSGEGVGLPLVDTDFINDISDEELLYFLQVGRSSDDSASQTGVLMPAYGGRVNGTPAEMWDIIAYIRQLNAD